MAFKKLNSQINAVSLGDGKDGTKKSVTGHLTGVELNKGTRKNSTIFSLQQRDGSTVKVWGSAAIDSNLLTGEGKNRVVNSTLKNCLVRLTYEGSKEFGAGKKKQTFKEIAVEVDATNKLKAK